MSEMREELKKFLGKQVLIDLIGKDFAPKGKLCAVNDDFIVVGEMRISIPAIAGFKLTDGGWK